MLLRGMKEANDGLPVVAPTARTLGARPLIDIPIDQNGMVWPGTGGISVTPNDPKKLPRHRRPRSLGGRGKDPVWGIPSSNLGAKLVYRADPKNPTGHGFIEPAYPMTFNEYQCALTKTRATWLLMIR